MWYTRLEFGLLAALTCLVCVVGAMASPLEAGSQPAGLALTAPAVQDGSLALVRAPDGARLLLNGGPTLDSAATLLGEQLRPWDRTIDVVVLADPREAHVLGLQRVVERYRVGLLLDGADTYPSAAYRQLRETARRRGVRRLQAEPDTEIAVGRSLVLEVLLAATPRQAAAGASPEQPVSADRSPEPLALRLRSADFSLLLPGDQPADRLEDLLAAGHPLASTVLLLTDRASRSPAAGDHVQAAGPELVVIQGAPWAPPSSPRTVSAPAFDADSAPTLYRTVVDGTLRLEARPDGYRILGR
jgi:beta-lactamase superfamily II metal-dependent hydrolase